MSRVLDHFPDPPPRTYTLPKYNWRLWLDGRIHALTREEFVDRDLFCNAAHQIAKKRGITVRTRMIDDEMIVQATLPPISAPRRQW
jgi:hypothetical protein